MPGSLTLPRACRLLGLALLLLGASSAPALTLHESRSSPHDLAVSGLLSGAPGGGIRYLRWADLRSLPTREIEVEGEFIPGRQRITVTPLQGLWDALPRSPKADTIVAECTDGYASVFTTADRATLSPMIVLEIDGAGPDRWPPPGLKFNPGPYVISVFEELSPGSSKVLDINHKRPWGVNSIIVVNERDHFASLLPRTGIADSREVAAGRSIWINSCFSCHEGPGALGGTKANRPLGILVAHAVYNEPFFRTYIRDPKSLVPSATMEPHPHYTEAHLDALVAFLRSVQP